jgi:Fe2+ or Zn2+ uptake regulation protein
MPRVLTARIVLTPSTSVPQRRVLQVLVEARGPLSKQEIANRIEFSLANVDFAVGYRNKLYFP